MKKDGTLQRTKTNNNVNIPSIFIKNLGWQHKDLLEIEVIGKKIIITKKED